MHYEITNHQCLACTKERSDRFFQELKTQKNQMNETKNNNTTDGLFTLKDTCKIIEHAEKPVLTIPGNFKFEKFEKAHCAAARECGRGVPFLCVVWIPGTWK